MGVIHITCKGAAWRPCAWALNARSAIEAGAALLLHDSDLSPTTLEEAAVTLLLDEAAAAKAREVEGLEFIPADESLKSAQEAFNAEYLADVAATLESRGVTDAQAKVDRYTALIEKWEGLIKPGMSAADMGQLRYDEIFAKQDLAAYGQQ